MNFFTSRGLKDTGLPEVMRQRFGHEFGFVGNHYGLSWPHLAPEVVTS